MSDLVASSVFYEDKTFYQSGFTVFCDSLDVARKFSRQHKNILQMIDEQIARLIRLGYDDLNRLGSQPIEYVDSKGRVQRKFLLRKDFFMRIAMQMPGDEAERWRTEFIFAFQHLESLAFDKVAPTKLAPAKLGLIDVPIYEETLWGETHIVRYEKKTRNEVSESDWIAANIMHLEKVIEGATKSLKRWTRRILLNSSMERT